MNYEDGILLQQWIREHPPAADLLWCEAAQRQWYFVRDELPALFGSVYNERNRKPEEIIRVVGSHHSKSVALPVYAIKVPKVEVRLRNNFFNWVMSVKVHEDIPSLPNFGHIFSQHERLEPVKLVYAEGFTEDWIFPPYGDAEHNFSATLSSNYYRLFTVLYLLTEALYLHDEWP